MPSFSPSRYVDEYKCVGDLARMLPWDTGRSARIMASAEDLVARAGMGNHRSGDIEQFLKQYSLNTAEGVALVALAESLLRVPDTATRNALISDKITAGKWLEADVATDDWLVRASRYGLSITKATLESLIARLGEPIIRTAVTQAIRMMGRQFVLGEAMGDAIKNARADMGRGYALSFDCLGEGARTQAMADGYFTAYRDAIGTLAAARDQIPADVKSRMGISVKLSALDPRYHPYQGETCRKRLAVRLLELAVEARRYDLTLTVDAEETERLTMSLDIIGDVARDPLLSGWDGLGLAVQAYQKYAPDLIDHVLQMGRDTGHRLRVRLVKGAYWDGEAKRAQVMGLPDYPLFTRKANTDLSYLVCAHKLLAAGDDVYPMFATHNAHTIAAILDLAQGRDINKYEFQRLHGMGQALHDAVVREERARSTIYAPVGTYDHLLAYLVRRLMENGANTSFVNQITQGKEALSDPYARAVEHATRRHRDLAVPGAMYGTDRRNSRGYDLAQDDERTPLMTQNMPDVQVGNAATQDQVARMIARAVAAHPSWDQGGVEYRAACLDKYADLMEQHTGALIHMLQIEGYKTLNDALAEIREAVDFARYYAAEARKIFAQGGTALPGPTGESNHLVMAGRGAFICISPWNFPLAIFTGQIVAALVAGNTVIAKPAEQTPRIGAMAVDLMIKAGIPDDVIQLAIGDGRVGAMLVSHPDIAGVAFTGSTEVARLINRTLAAKDGPIVPLIAETGGQNAMIVDSTALLETACDDIINSAFGSAGQRCSALRVLYVQHDVADTLMDLLKGAVELLRVGNPRDLSTDVGPVIDEEARTKLTRHAHYLNTLGARLVAKAPLHLQLQQIAPYFAPAIYEIDSIDQLPGEVFGPVLHVIRFASGHLDRVMNDIARTGFGLTFGVQTRLTERMKNLGSTAPAGNVYINRTMIGAVVGTQPFGGQGLSGTGPKAGGSHYLPRFATEKVISINTAAAGGNLALIAGSDD